jgi:hypothetical protein
MAQQPEQPRWITNPPPGLAQYLLSQNLKQQQPALHSSTQSTVQVVQPASASTLSSQVSQSNKEVVKPATDDLTLPSSTQIITDDSDKSQKSHIKTKGSAIPFTLPTWLTTSGPWESVDHAVADINRQWALCDDGVGVLHKGSQQNYVTKDQIQIQRKELYCYQKQTSQCRFRITLESRGIASSWDIAGVGQDCNHANPKTSSQQNAFASHRGIPEDLRVVGINLRKSGGTNSFIFKHLCTMYRERICVG